MDKTLEELIIFLESCNFSITPFDLPTNREVVILKENQGY